MPDPARTPTGLSAVGFLLAVFLSAGAHAAEGPVAHPIVAGFERFADGPKSGPVENGLLLFGELNCTSCHRAEPGLAAHLNRKQAPILDGIGLRARPAFVRAFLAAPHDVKPGTTMPDVFHGWPKGEKDDAVEALTQFLAAGGRLPHARLSRKDVAAGKTLYHQVGCAVCHGAIGEKTSAGPGASVPLGPLETKYTLPSLTAFLIDPLKDRPSGRMPALRLANEEARQIAQFLLRDLPGEFRPNVEYRYYEADDSWDKLPDFATIEPTSAGESDGFDVSVARRTNNVGLRFQGVFRAQREGRYTFFMKSDDGSKLYIDDNLVVDNDGVHPPQEKRGEYRLGQGNHRVRVDLFNAGGEMELEVGFRGPGLRRQPLAGFVSIKEGNDRADEPKGDDAIAIDPDLVTKGRELFGRVGCASCHEYRVDDRRVAAETEAPPLSALSAGKGCLAETPGKGRPQFDLSERQRTALAAAIGAVATLSARPPTHAETIARSMTALNCYACHERDGRGGVLATSNDLFATTQKEMGDEGRLPPLLTGVGAKLNESYLKAVLGEGAKDRLYMLTRMPRFGGANTAALAEALAAVDRVEPMATPTFDETPRRVKSDGRFLVGGMALGCIKCHTFKGVEAEGIQAIDMTVMARRLRRDWFHRYVVNPPAFRPGTRMPTGWPDGKSSLPKLLGGDTVRQVEAVWQFLSDGPNAATPYGLGREPMPLFVRDEAVIYRNFIQGAGPRAIGVGYPGNANLAFDANDLRIALIWQGGFMDASRHWNGRGEGFQPPMGDNVVALPPGAPFATLPSHTDAWPSRSSRELGYHFRGYRLGANRRPTFLYDLGPVHVEDEPEAVAGPRAPGLRRTLTLTAEAPVEHLYLRAALGASVKPQGGGWFLVNGEWKVRIASEGEGFVRASNGQDELLVPVRFSGKTATVVEEFEW